MTIKTIRIILALLFQPILPIFVVGIGLILGLGYITLANTSADKKITPAIDKCEIIRYYKGNEWIVKCNL